MLDIKALRLTDQEITAAFQVLPASEGVMADIADAALTKALWGIQHWLWTHEGEGAADRVRYLSEYLRSELLAAGMPRPEEK